MYSYGSYQDSGWSHYQSNHQPQARSLNKFTGIQPRNAQVQKQRVIHSEGRLPEAEDKEICRRTDETIMAFVRGVDKMTPAAPKNPMASQVMDRMIWLSRNASPEVQTELKRVVTKFNQITKERERLERAGLGNQALEEKPNPSESTLSAVKDAEVSHISGEKAEKVERPLKRAELSQEKEEAEEMISGREALKSSAEELDPLLKNLSTPHTAFNALSQTAKQIRKNVKTVSPMERDFSDQASNQIGLKHLEELEPALKTFKKGLDVGTTVVNFNSILKLSDERAKNEVENEKKIDNIKKQIRDLEFQIPRTDSNTVRASLIHQKDELEAELRKIKIESSREEAELGKKLVDTFLIIDGLVSGKIKELKYLKLLSNVANLVIEYDSIQDVAIKKKKIKEIITPLLSYREELINQLSKEKRGSPQEKLILLKYHRCNNQIEYLIDENFKCLRLEAISKSRSAGHVLAGLCTVGGVLLGGGAAAPLGLLGGFAPTIAQYFYTSFEMPPLETLLRERLVEIRKEGSAVYTTDPIFPLCNLEEIGYIKNHLKKIKENSEVLKSREVLMQKLNLLKAELNKNTDELENGKPGYLTRGEIPVEGSARHSDLMSRNSRIKEKMEKIHAQQEVYQSASKMFLSGADYVKEASNVKSLLHEITQSGNPKSLNALRELMENSGVDVSAFENNPEECILDYLSLAPSSEQ